MRSLTAILCLVAVFALQYGKLVSYWHCRINTIASAVRCDCEKKLVDQHPNGDTHTATALTAKEKTEEIVLLFETDEICQVPAVCADHIPAYTGLVPKIYTAAIFQPPRL
jgi:hypothetical protein